MSPFLLRELRTHYSTFAKVFVSRGYDNRWTVGYSFTKKGVRHPRGLCGTHAENWWKELMRDGREGKRVQLVSKRDGREIPLSCESEGIKRIVSFLNLLILMFNDSSVTVVIDEFDAGVFEYLLGELTSVVSEHGRGQLIFTSHNLRPLETIDRGFIAFTTASPRNRYWRMSNVKPSSNLRDFYYAILSWGDRKSGSTRPQTTATSNSLSWKLALPMRSKKVVLIIVEGPSDETAQVCATEAKRAEGCKHGQAGDAAANWRRAVSGSLHVVQP